MKSSYQTLLKKYLNHGKGVLTAEEIEAYAVARMPATKAAIQKVLIEVKNLIQFPVYKLMDLGSGTGAGILAASEVFGDLKKILAIESNPLMLKYAKILLREFSEIEFLQRDFCSLKAISPCELGLYAYSLGEVSDFTQAINEVFKKARIIVVIEPGTPRGFETIRKARKQLIDLGGKVLAPCPHQGNCPIQHGDWCHFSIRVQRSKEHKQTKGADLGWEDEKFSYIVIHKDGENHFRGDRVIRHPQKFSGYVYLNLCTPKGLEKKIVTKKEGAFYKKARKLKWGSLFSKEIVKGCNNDSPNEAISEAPNASDD